MTNHNRPTNAFSKSPQNLNEGKSNGHIRRSRCINALYAMRDLWNNSECPEKVIEVVENELNNGKADNAIKLFNAIKETEQKIDIEGDIGIKKVFVTEKQRKEVEEHIDKIINSD